MTPELTSLLARVAAIDRELLELLRKRTEIADQVARHGAGHQLPVLGCDTATSLDAAVRHHAHTLGIGEPIIRGLLELLSRSALERQASIGAWQHTHRGQRALIVGGAGAMGGWFSSFLGMVGYRVDACDPAWRRLPLSEGLYSSLADILALDDYDVIVVSVPLALTTKALGEVLARKPRGIVIEISSIKAPVLNLLSRAHYDGLRVAALHPMFGPRKSVFEQLNFVLACLGDPEAEKQLVAPILDHPSSNLVAVPFVHHDRLMGWLLGLAHLCGMLFGAALSCSGLDPEELQSCASTTFARQASTALSILDEDPGLYLDIQRLNPHRAEVMRATKNALDELVSHIEHDDRDAFFAAMARARKAVAPQE
jgi:chorismate mutase/prephenate dehydrogenase